MTTYHFYKGFKGSVSFSSLDRRYHGKIEDIKDNVIYDGTTKICCINDFHNAVDDWLEFHADVVGEPVPLNKNGYLGVFPSEKEYTKEELISYFLGYGQIDGAHHKTWVLDQVARIINDAPYEAKIARWANGHEEIRITIHSSEQYLQWVASMKDGEDGPETYEYDEGVAP